MKLSKRSRKAQETVTAQVVRRTDRRMPLPSDADEFLHLIQKVPLGRSPENPALDWQEQRVLWNKEGYCARVDCGAHHRGMRNSANNLLYCRYCAALIGRNTDPAILSFTKEEVLDEKETSTQETQPGD